MAAQLASLCDWTPLGVLPPGPLVCGYACWDIVHISHEAVLQVPFAKCNIWRKQPPVYSLETDPLCLRLQGK